MVPKLLRQLTTDLVSRAVVSGRSRIDLGDEDPDYPIYVIGDVHGCIDELKAAELLIEQDMKKTGRSGLTVLLGDYVDRGPHSSSVLEHLVDTTSSEIHRVALSGNHDEVFLKFIDKPRDLEAWLDFGGRKTLLSYGIDPRELPKARKRQLEILKTLLQEAVPRSHVEFLARLPVLLRIGRYVFVHAGVRPGISIERQLDHDLMWIREPFLEEGPKLPFLVIHGHSPVSEVDFGPGRVGIDTGAYYSGRLAVFKIEDGRGMAI